MSSVQRRADLLGEFVRGTNKYQSMIQDESRQRLLLSWILDQVPLLEVESIQSKTTSANLEICRKVYVSQHDSALKS